MISFLKRRKIAVLAVALVVITVIFAVRSGSNNGYETAIVSRGDLVRTTEIAGKVVPQEDADLSFEVGGTVSRTYKKVGDTVEAGEAIAELDRSSTNADLFKAEADLMAAKAELAKLQGGAALQSKVANSKTSVVQDILDAYTAADDAIYNKVDQFFKDARTPNPEIIFAFDDYDLWRNINADRVSVGAMLSSWRAFNQDLTATAYSAEDLDRAKLAVRQIADFLDDVARAVNAFEPATSLTQAQIDKYRTDVATARSNMNAAAAALISGEEGFTATVSDVPVQEARVASAEATVANYRSKLGKMVLRSPISGVISKQDAKAGESMSANAAVASVISKGRMIEAYVPEVSIAGVSLGADASVTLDAYGDGVLFKAKIVHVDPRETVRDGVSTYKVELQFTAPDERVRSGMTANISIETARKLEALFLPARAVVTEGSSESKRVTVVTEDGEMVDRVIETGMSDTKGNVEIVSGLAEGDTVVLNPKN